MVDGDFTEYLRKLKDATQIGTTTELLALGLCYERNVMVFEPFRMGYWLHHNSKYNDCFMVFFTASSNYDIVYRLFIEQTKCDIDLNEVSQKMIKLSVEGAEFVSLQESGTPGQHLQVIIIYS